jgi:hypothetical protein
MRSVQCRKLPFRPHHPALKWSTCRGLLFQSPQLKQFEHLTAHDAEENDGSVCIVYCACALTECKISPHAHVANCVWNKMTFFAALTPEKGSESGERFTRARLRHNKKKVHYFPTPLRPEAAGQLSCFSPPIPSSLSLTPSYIPHGPHRNGSPEATGITATNSFRFIIT